MRSRGGDVSIGYFRKHAIGTFSNFTNTLLPDSCLILHGNTSQPICKWHFRWYNINETVPRSSEISISVAFGFSSFYSIFLGASVEVSFDRSFPVGCDLAHILGFDDATPFLFVSVPSVRIHPVGFDTSDSRYRGGFKNKCNRFVWKRVFHPNELTIQRIKLFGTFVLRQLNYLLTRWCVPN